MGTDVSTRKTLLSLFACFESESESEYAADADAEVDIGLGYLVQLAGV